MTERHPQAMRTQEIEEVTNRYVIHPLSRFFAGRFARWGVHPNTVSLAGMAFGGAAALAYYHYASWPFAVLGFALMLGWHVMDGADGQLARMTGQTSELGRVLDGLCDHVAFTLVYISLALALTPVMGVWAWVLGVLAGASHVVQASAYEFQRQAYDFWVHGKAAPPVLEASAPPKRGLGGAFAWLSGAYQRVQLRFAAADVALYQAMGEALEQPGGRAKVREAYRAANLPALQRWNVLCSNYRTAAIFLACLAGYPALYFLFEIVVLNPVLALLMRMQRERLHDLHTSVADELPLIQAA